MLKLYSKIEPDNLLAIIHTKDDIDDKRIDISPPAEFLQGASKRLKAGTYFKPHRHNTLIRETTMTKIFKLLQWFFVNNM